MFVSGMGFFTDAYDLFVIGIVVVLLKPEWGLSTTQVSLLNSVTLAASAVGAIVFGRIADILGRKKIYGYEVLILAIGALASAFAPNFWFLLVCRAVLGIGIGGDYPVSATIMSEYSGKKSRGKMVGLVFAMQGAGPAGRPAAGRGPAGLRAVRDIIWRVLLAASARFPAWPCSTCAARSTRRPGSRRRAAPRTRPRRPSRPPPHGPRAPLRHSRRPTARGRPRPAIRRVRPRGSRRARRRASQILAPAPARCCAG